MLSKQLVGLRWRCPGVAAAASAGPLHDANRVLAFHRFIERAGEDVRVVAHLGTGHRFGYRIGFPGGGEWREVFNSDAYEAWVNPGVVGNGGCMVAQPELLHGFAHSAALALPANALLVFAR